MVNQAFRIKIAYRSEEEEEEKENTRDRSVPDGSDNQPDVTISLQKPALKSSVETAALDLA